MSIKLHYIEKGYGTPFIMLHGNGGSHKDFEKQIDYFSNYYRVIAIDTRGHGKSPKGFKKLSFDVFTEDLKHFLDSHNIKEGYFLGFSDGGNLLLNFIIKYPSYVSKLIVSGANLHPSGLKTIFYIQLLFYYYFAKFLSIFSKKYKSKKELLKLMIYEPDISEESLKKINVPSLIIAGTSDLIKDSHTKKIAGLIPGSKLCIIEGNHFILNSNSIEFNTAIQNFLKE